MLLKKKAGAKKRLELVHYSALVRGRKCPLCQKPLNDRVLFYPHIDGWFVKGFKQRLWLYVNCGHCHSDIALWKIGIMRPYGDIEANRYAPSLQVEYQRIIEERKRLGI